MTKKEFGFKKILLISVWILVAAIGIEVALEASNLILFGVQIEDVEVGGCTKSKAMEKLTVEKEKILNEKVTLLIDEKEYTYSKRELGLQLDVKDAVDKAYQVGRNGSIAERLQRRNQYQPIEITKTWDKEVFLNSIKPLVNLYNSYPVDAVLKSKGQEEKLTELKSPKILDIEDIFLQLQNSVSGDIIIQVKYETNSQSID